MIQIQHTNINASLVTHLKFVRSDADKRLNFYIDLLDCLAYNKTIPSTTSLCTYYGFNSDLTPRTLLNPFLKKTFRKKGKKYDISINEVESLFFSGTKHCIKNSTSLTAFRDLHAFFTLVKRNLLEILIGIPTNLEAFTTAQYNLQSTPVVKFCLENIFRYEEFTDKGFEIGGDVWSSYKLTSSLDIHVCPYCNRNWINTVTTKDDKKIVNPQLDHFFCKSKFPLLRLSFYNLIPSCDTCNSRLKKSDQFNLTDYLHPYEAGYGNGVRFKAIALNSDSAIGSSGEYLISLEYDQITPNRSKIEKNHSTFKIDDIYMKHGDIVSEIFRKKYLFSIRYLEILKGTIQTHEISYEEMYRIAFGNYFKESDFKRRPFSKLTKDIASQLGMIYKL